MKKAINIVLKNLGYQINKYDKKAMKYFLFENNYSVDLFPTIITGWDNSPRSGKNGLMLVDYDPVIFRKHIDEALQFTSKNANKIVFVKSWNEWAEGNYLEPEAEFKKDFIITLNEGITLYNERANK